jgi:hypothetical protein
MSRLLLVLPLLLFLSGLAMVAAIPGSWGAGNHAALQAWMPPLAGLIFALPALYVGGLTLIKTYARSGGDAGVFGFQLIFGASIFIVLALLETILAIRLGEPSTYNSLKRLDGTVHTTALAFFAVTVTGTAFAAGWLSVGSFLYVQGIISDKESHFTRTLDEPDLMDDFLHSRPIERPWR